jgi:hypothetical protein
MGQTIISAGLVIIVTIAVINANRLVINAEASKLEGLARMQAADIAMELITEIRLKKFDENEVTTEYQSTSAFTASGSLGRESEWAGYPDAYPYDSADKFDDIDDYHGYRRSVTTSNISGYQVDCVVFYSTPDNPDTNAGTRTYFKTLEVYVSHATYLPNAIRINFTTSY